MIIRKMIREDIPELANLYKQFWNEASDALKMRKQFDKLQHQNTHILLCAEDNNRLVGSVMGVVCEELYGDCKPFLVVENMIVHKDLRRQGIGKALIAELEKLALERSCTQMILVTETNRLDACLFYESIGFNKSKNKGYKKKLKSL